MPMTALYRAIEFCLMSALAQGPAWARGEVWLDVPFVAQVGNGCGPACISMVMKYWAATRHRQPDGDADEDVIRRIVELPAKGTFSKDVAGYFENHGFHPYVFAGAWTDLEHHLARGRPLIVAIAQSSDTFHYLVATGVDSAQGVLLVNDPARRKLRKVKRADFEKAWSRCGFWTLLALPKDES